MGFLCVVLEFAQTTLILFSSPTFGALAHASDFIYMLQYFELSSRLSAYVFCLFHLDKRQGRKMQGPKDLLASGIPIVYSA